MSHPTRRVVPRPIPGLLAGLFLLAAGLAPGCANAPDAPRKQVSVDCREAALEGGGTTPECAATERMGTPADEGGYTDPDQQPSPPPPPTQSNRP